MLLPDQLRVPDPAIARSGLAPAPIPGAITATHVRVSPSKPPKEKWEEEFKQQELARINSLDSSEGGSGSAEDSHEEKCRAVQPQSRIAVRLNVGLGSPEKQELGLQLQQQQRHKQRKLKKQPKKPPTKSRQTGMVSEVHRKQGTVDVVYDNGDKDYSVPIEFIDLVSSSDEGENHHEEINNGDELQSYSSSASSSSCSAEEEEEEEYEEACEVDTRSITTAASANAATRRIGFAPVHDEVQAQRTARRRELERLELERERRERQARAAEERQAKLRAREALFLDVYEAAESRRGTEEKEEAGGGLGEEGERGSTGSSGAQSEDIQEEEVVEDEDDDDDEEEEIGMPSRATLDAMCSEALYRLRSDSEDNGSSSGDSSSTYGDLEKIMEALNAPSPTNMAWTRPDIGFMESDDESEYDAADMYRWSRAQEVEEEQDPPDSEEGRAENAALGYYGEDLDFHPGEGSVESDHELAGVGGFDARRAVGNRRATGTKVWDARIWDRASSEDNQGDDDESGGANPTEVLPYAYLEEEEEEESRAASFQHKHQRGGSRTQRYPRRAGLLSGFDSFHEDAGDMVDGGVGDAAETGSFAVAVRADDGCATAVLSPSDFGRALLSLSLLEDTTTTTIGGLGFDAAAPLLPGIAPGASGRAEDGGIDGDGGGGGDDDDDDDYESAKLPTRLRYEDWAARAAIFENNGMYPTPSFSGVLKGVDAMSDWSYSESDSDFEDEDDGAMSDASSKHSSRRIHPWAASSLSPPRNLPRDDMDCRLSPPTPGDKDRQGIHVTGVPWVSVSSELPAAAYYW